MKKAGKLRFGTDGLNGLDYKLKLIRKERLYTQFVVELMHEDPYA